MYLYPRRRPTRRQTLMDYAALRPREKLSFEVMRGCPNGDGGAVLVLPGIFRGDGDSRGLRDHLRMLGYQPYGWELGVNMGPTQVTLQRVALRLRRLAEQHGPVRVIGFSMGGLLARWLAQTRPAMVRQVITVCSPFAAPFDSAWLPVRPFMPLWGGVDLWALAVVVGQTPEVPWAAIYSRHDGVVAWEACMDARAPERCFEVAVRHRMALREAAVFRALAGVMADVK